MSILHLHSSPSGNSECAWADGELWRCMCQIQINQGYLNVWGFFVCAKFPIRWALVGVSFFSRSAAHVIIYTHSRFPFYTFFFQLIWHLIDFSICCISFSFTFQNGLLLVFLLLFLYISFLLDLPFVSGLFFLKRISFSSFYELQYFNSASFFFSIHCIHPYCELCFCLTALCLFCQFIIVVVPPSWISIFLAIVRNAHCDYKFDMVVVHKAIALNCWRSHGG